jgi:hypothetical protein
MALVAFALIAARLQSQHVCHDCDKALLIPAIPVRKEATFDESKCCYPLYLCKRR